MARQDANELFQTTSFLYGGNAAYIEDLYARYQDDPATVSEEWQSFFGALKDEPDTVRKAAGGASWKKQNWPIPANGELVSADSCSDVSWTERAHDPARDLLEQEIPGLVPERIIHALEVIHVQHANAHGAVALMRPVHAGLQFLHQQAAVGQA